MKLVTCFVVMVCLDGLEVIALRGRARGRAKTRQRVVHHRAGFLFERHALHEIVGASFGGQSGGLRRDRAGRCG